MTNSAPQPIEEPISREKEVENLPRIPQAKDSYVKLAMRNMVRKGKQSLWHFFLTTAGLVGLLIGLAYLTKP